MFVFCLGYTFISSYFEYALLIISLFNVDVYGLDGEQRGDK